MSNKTNAAVAVATTPVVSVRQNGTSQVNPNSIRQIVMTGLLAGESTKDIAVKVQAAHPDSAAAKKSVKHIAFYRAVLRREGRLPKAGAAK